MRLNVWSPLPPASSGIADYVAEALPALGRRAEIVLVVPDPTAVDPDLAAAFPVRRPETAAPADLDLYHLGNSPAHGYVYRAARRRPGVAFLHDWSLHHLVLAETLERGDPSAYAAEMRRSHGETGTFVARQVARALGGDLLPARFPLNDRVLEGSLAAVTLSRWMAERVRRRVPDRPVLALPHHLSLPLDPLPSREEARRALGLPTGARILTAPGLATTAKRLEVAVSVAGRLRARHPALLLVVAGAVEPGLPLARWAEAAGMEGALRITGRTDLANFIRHLCAADVVLGLRFPSHGEMSGALVRALGVGRPVVVSAGTPAADEFPEGVVAVVDPGRRESAHLEVLLARLLEDHALAAAMGRAARDHVRQHHRLESTVETLAAFLEDVAAERGALEQQLAADQAPEGTLVAYLMEEVRWGARDLGLAGVALGLEPILSALAGAKR